MNSTAPKNIKKKHLKWLKKIGLFVGFLFLVPTTLFIIGWFSRDLLIDELQEWYKNNNNGTLEIGDVDATFLEGFPNVGFTISDIQQVGTDTILDKRTTTYIKQAKVSIAAKDLLSGDIQFKNILVENAKIRTEILSKKSVAAYIQLKKESQKNRKEGLELPAWLHSDKFNIRLKNIHFVSKDTMLNKSFNLEIRNIGGRFKKEDNNIKGTLDFTIKVNDLGFNTMKGSYINGAMLTGSPEIVVQEINNTINIPEFLLNLDKESFEVIANFDFNEVTQYNFSLKNPNTDFGALRSFLPDSISAKLSAYEITNPLNTMLSLDGKFRYGDIPKVYGQFSTEANSISIENDYNLTKVNFNGLLTNQLYNDKDSIQKKQSKADVRVLFEDFQAHLDDIKIVAEDSYFQSSRESANFVEANVNIAGNNENLAKILQNENFNFQGGNFTFAANIYGDISDISEIFDRANGRFTLNKTNVILKKNSLQLPVEIIDINLREKNSRLEKLQINLPNGENLIFKGSITNVSSLISDNPNKPTSTKVSMDFQNINLNDFIATIIEFMPESNKKATNLKTLNETFETIYNKFHPEIFLNLNSVEYNELIFNDFNTNISFTNAETIYFDNLNFKYNNAKTALKGTIRVPEPGNTVAEPIFLDFEASSSGPIKMFQKLFNISLVDINAGTYQFSGKITGNVQKSEELLSNASGDLKLLNSRFYYPNAAMDIGFDSLSVNVDNSNISLNSFELELGDHYPFTLNSEIKNFPGFLLDEIENNGSIKLAIEAPYIDLDEWMKIGFGTDTNNSEKELKNPKLYEVFKNINELSPELYLAVDSLKFRNLITRDIGAQVYFENDSILKLKDLRIKYKGSNAKIDGSIAANDVSTLSSNQNPFAFNFYAEVKGRSKDLNDLLKTVNFVFQSGNFDFKGSYAGQSKDLKILNPNAQGYLSLDKSRINIEGTDIQILVDSLDLNIENNLATLERLDVDLPGKSSLDIKGSINNFSNFINNDQENESHSSTFIIKSPYLNKKDIKTFIGSTSKNTDSSKTSQLELKKLKAILKSIHNSYYPSAKIEIDSLLYDNLAVSNFRSDLGFQNNGSFKINDTRLNFLKGRVNLNVVAGIGNSENLPVKIQLNMENIDLEELVKGLDYFQNEELRDTEKLSGNLNLNLDADAVLNNNGQLNMDSVNGTLQLDLKDLALYNYKPIMESVVLMKEERFDSLAFRPIRQTFEVIDGEIIIPRTEIQSSALHVFVEGRMKLDEYINIWLSLPWNNLKSRDNTILPEKTTYQEAGSKFHIQLVKDENSDKPRRQKLRTKFRLGTGKKEKSFQEN
ncbi:AsmA-like C-terminal region-containing protein [Christiangramia forsetii]|uniref:Uncharacterized protein n=2 Tax=Christiangramia forsetii TaxID=411153 RepID=A0M2R4_CHRFK|nr:AsmA-like C-terminal region-containing protein [Christiangramia forsetii]GGG44405.1 hypothetical protein GCM10011532_30480 [Christiangramia forsetii]CAL66909.1 conserved hypothetical protein [Christiangramia forsetii KT0803]